MSTTVAQAVSAVVGFFNGNSKSFNEDANYNKLFLASIQNWANDRLEIQGHLFLNEVHDMLGIARTPEGQRKGWLKGGHGIDFQPVMNKVGDWKLTFNVDGEIIDLI